MFYPGWEETMGSTDYIWPPTFNKVFLGRSFPSQRKKYKYLKSKQVIRALSPAAICSAFLSLQLNIKITGSHSSNISTAVPYSTTWKGCQLLSLGGIAVSATTVYCLQRCAAISVTSLLVSRVTPQAAYARATGCSLTPNKGAEGGRQERPLYKYWWERRNSVASG